MKPFTVEHSKLTLEAMKMEQSTLNLLITLSSGALTLYFNFFDKLGFIGILALVSIAAPVFWVLALIYALYAHKLLSVLWIMLIRYSANCEENDRKTSEFRKEVNRRYEYVRNNRSNLTPEELDKIEAENEKQRNELEENFATFEETAKRFGESYFPSQEKQSESVANSMGFFVAGFAVVLISFIASFVIRTRIWEAFTHAT